MEKFFLQLPTKTLRGKFLTFNIPIMLLALSCVFMVFAVIDYREAINNFQMRLDYLVDTNKSDLSVAMAEGQNELQQAIFRTIAQDPNIVKVILYDKNDNVVFKSERNNHDHKYYITERNSQLFNNKNYVGTLHIVASAKKHLNTVGSRILLDLYLALFAVLVMTLSALVVNRYTIDTPLAKLLSAIQLTKATKINQTVEWNSQDEIGLLVADFNEMQRQIYKQTETLIIAKEEAEAGNKAKSEFLANISHELRTPMHAILGLTNVCIKKINELSKQEILESLQATKVSSERLLNLLNELLDLSKLESGKMQFDIQHHNLLNVTEWVVKELNPLIKEKDLQIILKHEQLDSMAGEFDYLKIAQVVTNLLSNAIKFSPKGSDIVINLRSDDNNLIFSIADNGIGVPAGEINKIFEKFIQSSKTKTSAGGTGLGLSICKNIIIAHHGIISVNHNSPQGTIFMFKLPKKYR